MTTINNQNNSPDAELQAMIAANLAAQAKDGKKKEGQEAILSQLSQAIEGVLEELASPVATKGTGSKVVHVAFNASAPSGHASAPSGNPTDGEMQAMIGKLMSTLTDLQGSIAKYNNLNAQANSAVGDALVKEMNAQVKNVIKELKNQAEAESKADFWHRFLEWIGGIVAAVVTVLSLGSGSVVLPLIIATLTILSMTGTLDKLTKAIADSISKDLVADGYPKDKADIIAKILADVIVIAATVVVTAGAGSMGVAAEQSEKTIAAKLFKVICQTIVAETQVIASVNFGSDLMAAVLIKMKDGNAKSDLQMIFGALIDLVAMIAGMGLGGVSVMTSGDSPIFSPNVLKLLGVLMGAGSLVQAIGQGGSAAASANLAADTDTLGHIQGLVTELQALVRRNGQEAASDSKAAIDRQKVWAQDLSSLAMELNRESAAVAQVLRA